MIIGIGTDCFDVQRMERERAQAGFCESLFSPAEIAYCESKAYPAEHFAARFAAKEAIVKALASAAGPGAYWHDIEITNRPTGEPEVRLSGRLQLLAERRGVQRIHISLAHTGDFATASAIAES